MSSTMMNRARLAGAAGQQFAGQRDMYEVCGYHRVLEINDYFDMYERGDICGRIVDAYPDATWGEPPAIVVPDSKDDDGSPVAIEAFDDLAKKHQIWRTLHRLDRLTNVGHYGVLVIGLDGGEPMYTPAGGNDHGLLYLQPHSERTVQIIEWEDSPQSPRYGLPKMYRVEAGTNWTGRGAGRVFLKVHHSRVIHVAERPLEDISIGTPRLKRVANRIMDVDKLLGGGAEIFWQNAAQIMALKAEAETEFDLAAKEDMENQIEEMQHGLRRWLRLRGVEPQQLAGTMNADPSNLIDKEMDFIAGATGIPKRILIGSERGELASSQDETAWSNRIMERREQHAGPNIIEPLIDRLMGFGCLKKQPYEVQWPDEDTLGEEARATIAKTKAEAMSAYNGMPGNELIATPAEVREMIGFEGPPPAPPVEEPINEGDPEVVEQFSALRRAK